MNYPDYKTRALSLHNELRSRHGSPALQWSYQLQKDAKEYATYLVSRVNYRRQPQELELKDNVSWGQNLFELRRSGDELQEISEVTAVERAIDCWYNEIHDYNWAHPPGPSSFNKSGLSFSQIVWLATTKLGVGIASNVAGDRVVVVAFYEKRGNVRGEFSINVKNVRPLTKIGGQTGSNWRSTTKTTLSTTRQGNTPVTSVTSSFNRNNLRVTPASQTTGSGRSQDKAPVPALLTAGLDMHNQFRRKHGAPLLKLDAKLCLQAQRVAQAFVDNKRSEEGSTMGVGRNVYQARGSNLDPMEAVKTAVTRWYSQQSEYNWAAPLSSRHQANLFSQLIWKGVSDLGIGLAVSGNGQHIAIVGLYTPPGNIASEKSYRDNVRPALY